MIDREPALSLGPADGTAVLDCLDHAIVMVSADLRVLWRNAAAGRFFPNLELGAPWDTASLDLVDADGTVLTRQTCPLLRAIDGLAVRDVLLGSRSDGRWYLVTMTAGPPQAGGEPCFVVSASDVTHQYEREKRERTMARRLRALNAIATTTGDESSACIEHALRFAVGELRLDQGYLGAIDEPSQTLVMQTVVARDDCPSYGADHRYSLHQTLIGRVAEAGDVFVAPDVVKARAHFGVVHTDEWRSYIASPVHLGGERYGVIGFKGRQVREPAFGEDEVEFVRVTRDLIAAALERENKQRQLGALAFYDSLTGLANRVLFNDRLRQCMIAARRQKSRFALFFIDLDRFKDVNDRLGHGVGDEVLRAIGTALTACARAGDTVCRYGGDEFIVLAPEIGAVDAVVDLAERLSRAARYEGVARDIAFSVTASVGISVYPDHGDDIEALVHLADTAMFASKSTPRRRYAVASDTAAATA